MKLPKLWFISDPHFGHKNIIQYEDRPFKDTEHMDNVIIENYQNTVDENDIVFWLGDMLFCNTKRMEYITSRLTKGRKILIRGNHDGGISNAKFRRLGFDPHRMYQVMNSLILTHEPISEANINILRSETSIRANVHGHVHSQNQHLDPTKYCCVSVECTDYKPISFSDVLGRLKDGEAWQRWAKWKQRQEG